MALVDASILAMSHPLLLTEDAAIVFFNLVFFFIDINGAIIVNAVIVITNEILLGSLVRGFIISTGNAFCQVISTTSLFIFILIV